MGSHDAARTPPAQPPKGAGHSGLNAALTRFSCEGQPDVNQASRKEQADKHNDPDVIHIGEFTINELEDLKQHQKSRNDLQNKPRPAQSCTPRRRHAVVSIAGYRVTCIRLSGRNALSDSLASSVPCHELDMATP